MACQQAAVQFAYLLFVFAADSFAPARAAHGFFLCSYPPVHLNGISRITFPFYFRSYES